MLTFRRATLADAAAVVALVQSAYRGESGKRGWTTETDLLDGQRTDLEEVSTLLGRDGSVVLLGEIEGELCASCHLERHGDAAHFGMFSVDPRRQGATLGRQLLAEAERFANDVWRCQSMILHVIDVRDELLRWYERRGYQRTGEHAPFPYDDPRAGIPKRPDLRFEILQKALTAMTA